MTAEEYVKQSQAFKNKYLETRWFVAEVNYYAAIGNTLDSLRGHLRFGCDIDRDFILGELGFLLGALVEHQVCTMAHGVFISHDWRRSIEMVPAGVNGCANSILNMTKTDDPERRCHFFANACSHLGFNFEDVASRSLENMKREYDQQKRIEI
jgi:hypothetical protein